LTAPAERRAHSTGCINVSARARARRWNHGKPIAIQHFLRRVRKMLLEAARMKEAFSQHLLFGMENALILKLKNSCG
jgi:hypothetical protein